MRPSRMTSTRCESPSSSGISDEISKTATKQFPKFQHQFGPLAEKLDALGLPGADTVRSLNQELADVLLTDASDAPQRLGAEESPLYSGLKWATEVDRALKNGLEATVDPDKPSGEGRHFLRRGGVGQGIGHGVAGPDPRGTDRVHDLVGPPGQLAEAESDPGGRRNHRGEIRVVLGDPPEAEAAIPGVRRFAHGGKY